jgi:cytochrome c peroxidase
VGRLRADASYAEAFDGAFGTPPTQDAVGKALASYLRTLLAGNSVHDRALAKAGGARLTEEHYADVLGERDLKLLGRSRAEAAAVLVKGQALFRGKGGKGEKNAGCSSCHTPGEGHYSDGEFHNIGVGAPFVKGEATGRFVAAPLGQKTATLIGAYKTPTLRSLLRTAPYFHDGSADDLEAAVRKHLTAPSSAPPHAPINYLDPKMKTPDGAFKDLGLSDRDVAALVLFLRALNGDNVDAFVKAAPRPRK